jgi:hypothetical protein
MFDSWRLKYQRWRVQAAYNRDEQALIRRKASQAEFAELNASEYFNIRLFDEEIDRLNALRLWRQGNALDLEMPDLDQKEMWTSSEDGRYTFLSIKGRSCVRHLIDVEKARRFEVKTMWVTRIVLPIIASLVGIIGAVTGLVAVLHRK